MDSQQSFINLLADDVWSETDIISRTESEIRSEFSADAETIINRKVSGALLGAYTMTDADKADQQRFATVTFAAQARGNQARQDMALLQAAMNVETAQRRLALEVVSPKTITVEQEDGTTKRVANPDYVKDTAERQAAQEVLDAATQEVLDVVAMRAAARESNSQVVSDGE